MSLVLIADDDKGARAQLKKVLEKAGHKVLEATGGQQALDLARADDVDLVLLDIKLPDKDGLQVLEEMRAEQKLARVPVMVMATEADNDTLVKTFRWDVVDFIPKPFNADVLAAKVGAHTRLNQAYKFSRKLTKEMYMSRIDRMETEMRATDEDVSEAERHFRWMQPKPPQVEGYRIEVCYKPLGRLGGDFYDFVWLDRDRLAIVVGDVSGHGIQAAILQVMARKLISLALRQENGDLARMVEFANRELTNDLPPGSFVAACAAVLDTRNHTWKHVRCGVPYPILFRGAEVDSVVTPGGPLGLTQNTEWRMDAGLFQCELSFGDGLMLLSDGVIELPIDDKGGQFETEGLIKAISDTDPGASFIAKVAERVDIEHKSEDDITMITVMRFVEPKSNT
ncbi:MAG: SpoIIE family protein phosphatase [Planctomycetes bacterium]|nr:SpoIIE family protein phosphatase [Planctomycetota bacterium]